MQPTTVGVTYTRKFNLGNFESLELGINLYAKVDPDEDVECDSFARNRVIEG